MTAAPSFSRLWLVLHLSQQQRFKLADQEVACRSNVVLNTTRFPLFSASDKNCWRIFSNTEGKYICCEAAHIFISLTTHTAALEKKGGKKPQTLKDFHLL